MKSYDLDIDPRRSPIAKPWGLVVAICAETQQRCAAVPLRCRGQKSALSDQAWPRYNQGPGRDTENQ